MLAAGGGTEVPLKFADCVVVMELGRLKGPVKWSWEAEEVISVCLLEPTLEQPLDARLGFFGGAVACSITNLIAVA